LVSPHDVERQELISEFRNGPPQKKAIEVVLGGEGGARLPLCDVLNGTGKLEFGRAKSIFFCLLTRNEIQETALKQQHFA
jgi:hypothetical protein